MYTSEAPGSSCPTAAHLLVGPDQLFPPAPWEAGKEGTTSLPPRWQRAWPGGSRGVGRAGPHMFHPWHTPRPLEKPRGRRLTSGNPLRPSRAPGRLLSPRAWGPPSSPTRNSSGTGRRRPCTVGRSRSEARFHPSTPALAAASQWPGALLEVVRRVLAPPLGSSGILGMALTAASVSSW